MPRLYGDPHASSRVLGLQTLESGAHDAVI